MSAPQPYKTAGTLMLVAGILNLVVGFFLVIALLLVALPCCFLGFVPMIWGVVEIVFGVQIMNGKRVPFASALSIVGIVIAALSLLSGLSIVPLVLEIICLVQLNGPDARLYLNEAGDDLLV
jgi:hypothetical protein